GQLIITVVVCPQAKIRAGNNLYQQIAQRQQWPAHGALYCPNKPTNQQYQCQTTQQIGLHQLSGKMLRSVPYCYCGTELLLNKSLSQLGKAGDPKLNFAINGRLIQNAHQQCVTAGIANPLAIMLN